MQGSISESTGYQGRRFAGAWRPARLLLRVAALAAITAGLLPMLGRSAGAAGQSTTNACTNSVVSGPSEIPMVLDGTAPSSASAGAAASVTGLSVTAEVPASFIQAAVNIHVLSDGQHVTGTVSVDIHATNATPVDKVLSGNGSGTVHAPGTPPVAQPLSVLVPLPTTSWTPAAEGDVTLAQALSGSLTATGPAGMITDGSIAVAANLGALGTVSIICVPGTVSGTTIDRASSVTPFVTFSATSATSTSSTSSTESTTTSTSSTTTTLPTTTTTAAGTPSITLSATANLKPGDTVVVTGSNFDPFSTIALVECSPLAATSSNAQDECDITKVVFVTSDASGAFTGTVKILKTGATKPYDFSPADPKAVCPPAAGADCVIAAANAGNQSQQAAVAIHFQGSSSGTTTSTASVLAASTTSTLPKTGAGPMTFVLLGLALLLIDLGYMLMSATRPAPDPGLLRRIWRR